MANLHDSDDARIVLAHIEQLNLDGWQNLLSGLGTALDKSRYNQFLRSALFTRETLTALIDESDIAHRIVSKLPKEATRPGYVIQHEKADELRKFADEYCFDQELLDCWIWGRGFGGAILVVAAEDGKAFDQELLPDTPIKRVDFVRCVPRWNSDPTQLERNPMSKRFGMPEHYNVVYETWNQRVHYSRTIRFDGQPTSYEERIRQNGWTHSVLRAPYEAMQNFDTTWGSVGVMMQEAVVSKYGIKGLISAIAAGGVAEQNVLRRMQLVNSGKSVARAVVHDADQETFGRDSLTFTGIGEILNQTMYRMAAAAEMPVTILFGRSPAGMNATGESDMRQWYDSISSEREKKLKPALLYFYRIACRVLNFNADKLDIEFNPLWQATRTEELQAKKLQAEVDDIYIANGTLLPEEIAKSRFTEEGFSYDTELDQELRKPDDTTDDVGTTRVVELTPTDQKIFITLNEARSIYSLDDWPDSEDGKLPLAAFEAKAMAYGDTTGTAQGETDTGKDATPKETPASPNVPGPAPGAGPQNPPPTNGDISKRMPPTVRENPEDNPSGST